MQWKDFSFFTSTFKTPTSLKLPIGSFSLSTSKSLTLAPLLAILSWLLLSLYRFYSPSLQVFWVSIRFSNKKWCGSLVWCSEQWMSRTRGSGIVMNEEHNSRIRRNCIDEEWRVTEDEWIKIQNSQLTLSLLLFC